MKGQFHRLHRLAFVSTVLAVASGCAVTQKPGNGVAKRFVEQSTCTAYWLYLPDDYIQAGNDPSNHRRWPLVVTFHGLRPYDNASPQIQAWQQEADRYGFIVIAPELRTCDSLTMQFPLRDPTLPYVQEDERGVLAVMDEVCRRTNADPTRVLATSFSSGGYMAHFMVNRHPERFTVLAVGGSNFSSSLLDPAQVPKYRRMKIGIFFGTNDFKVCRDESIEAIGWYRSRQFSVTARKVSGMGHEREPATTGAFFASIIGVSPKSPPDVGEMVVQSVDEIPEYRPVGRSEPVNRTTPANPSSRITTAEPTYQPATDTNTNVIFAPPASAHPAVRTTPRAGSTKTPQGQSGTPASRSPSPERPASGQNTTPKRPVHVPYSFLDDPEKADLLTIDVNQTDASSNPAIGQIRVLGNTSSGETPIWINLIAEIPPSMKKDASILWTDNGIPIADDAFETRSVLRQSGTHHIQAHIITAKNRRIVLTTQIDIPTPTSAPARS